MGKKQHQKSNDLSVKPKNKSLPLVKRHDLNVFVDAILVSSVRIMTGSFLNTK